MTAVKLAAIFNHLEVSRLFERRSMGRKLFVGRSSLGPT